MVFYIVQKGDFVNFPMKPNTQVYKNYTFTKNREGWWNDNTAMIGIDTGRFQTITTDWHKYCCKTWYIGDLINLD